MNASFIINFKQAMSNDGFDIKERPIADGKFHRFGLSEDKGKQPCWYVLHDAAMPYGAFGCFKRDIKNSWCLRSKASFTDAERHQYDIQSRAMEALIKRERQ